MAKRFDKMTPAEKFVRLMIRGWKEKKKKYVACRFGNSVDGYCAIGVVASELGCSPSEIRDKIGFFLYGFTDHSDRAGSKTAAIRAVKKFLLDR